MDTFDLRWPKTTATLCTNGWRCRIVWRGKKGGLGGTIENNDQCKRRVADSLEGAPGLLDELREAGYMDLADEIQTLAPLGPLAPVAPSQQVSQRDGDPGPTPPRTPGKVIDAWAKSLSGSPGWEACSNRRAKVWHEVANVGITAGGEEWQDDVLLKTPAAKGKPEWVLKCVCQAAPKGHERAAPRYYAAESFHGICACLAAMEEYRSMDAVEAFIEGVKELAGRFDEVAEAVDGWAREKAAR